jgi:hypothetical protein
MPTGGRSGWRRTPKISCAGEPPRTRPTTSTCRYARDRYRKAAQCAFMSAFDLAALRPSRFWMAVSTEANSPAKCRHCAEATWRRTVVRSARIAIERCLAVSRSNGCLMASSNPALPGPSSPKNSLSPSCVRKIAKGKWDTGPTPGDGYPAARQRMLDTISATQPSNPVFFGGDIHSFWVTDLKADFSNPSSVSVATEVVGTSVTFDPPPYELIKGVLPENPHVRYFESRYRGYVAVDLFRERMETRLQVISDRRDPKATVSTLKRFGVESGKPGAIPA